jgi:hypothetical protein
VPIVTVVATPEPEGPPNKNDDSTTARPAALRLPPIAAKEKSMKKRGNERSAATALFVLTAAALPLGCNNTQPGEACTSDLESTRSRRPIST